MSSQSERVQAVFLAAVDKPAAERVDFLDRECGTDMDFRSRVEALLRSHDVPGSFLESPPPGLAIGATVNQPMAEGPGTQIGPYKLLQQIGEGGMGVVYMAEQDKPIQRRVALKVIKPGMDSKQVVARFEAERQALAIMDHQNIARVFDAGTTENGRPYFAMELVRGVPITEYCDHNKLTLRHRLDLFCQVCHAVQHAHQKGIIHRDIKPSNVMVTLYDGKPVPKVIDFGVAKAIQQKLTEKTLFTAYGNLIGTPEYMSPEQAEMSGLDVDTRADVYALGVLLYELLTGTTPITREQLHKVGLDEILHSIRQVEPQRPSVRLSQSGDKLASISEHRCTEPGKLSRFVRGDLDWIVMKALEKDRTRRYETSNALASDVKRYLEHEAVEASPPSTTYRLRKFAVKNRSVVATVGAFCGVLVLSTVVSLLMAREMMIERRKAMALLQSYKEEILDRALIAAVGGDLEETAIAIEEAQKVGVPESFLRFLEALAAMFGGEEIRAVQLLEDVVEEHPNDAKAWALLFNAQRHQGNLDGYALAEAKLMELADSQNQLDLYQRMFVGYAESDTHVAQEQGVDRLRGVVRDRPSWAIARAMLAQGLCNIGNDRREEDVIDEAKKELLIAETLLPDNPFVNAVALQVLTAEIVHAYENKLPTIDLESSAATSVATLQQDHRKYVYGRITLGRYFSALDRPAESLKEWQVASSHGGGTMVQSSVGCLSLRLGILDKMKDRGVPWSEVLESEVENALSVARNPKANEAQIYRVWRNYVLKLLGDEISANRDWQDLRKNAIAIPLWLRNPLDLLTEECSPLELLDEASELGSRFWDGHTHFCVGAYYLGKYDRQKALNHFEKCIEANSYESDFHHLAFALRDKLRADPNWPSSLRKNE